jgi:hypothetical protein
MAMTHMADVVDAVKKTPALVVKKVLPSALHNQERLPVRETERGADQPFPFGQD